MVLDKELTLATTPLGGALHPTERGATTGILDWMGSVGWRGTCNFPRYERRAETIACAQSAAPSRLRRVGKERGRPRSHGGGAAATATTLGGTCLPVRMATRT